MAIGTALAVVGGISAIGGIVASRRAARMQRDQLAQWNAVYGDVQDQLAEYYGGLDADEFTAQGLENQQKAFQQAQAELEQSFEQRGLGQSGQVKDASQTVALENARAKARIRQDAPHQVMERKQSFLATGLGQKQNLDQAALTSQQNEANAFFGAAGTALTSYATGLGEGTIPSTTASTVTAASPTPKLELA